MVRAVYVGWSARADVAQWLRRSQSGHLTEPFGPNAGKQVDCGFCDATGKVNCVRTAAHGLAAASGCNGSGRVKTTCDACHGSGRV